VTPSTLQLSKDLGRRVMACQTHLGGGSYLAGRICIFIQEVVQPKLHYKPTQPFGWCRCKARLDPSKRRS
jgi:hypothetical protein